MIVKELVWKEQKRNDGDTISFAKTDMGKFSVLNRLTGFGTLTGEDIRDTETGFLDKDNKFWLASGMIDIRDYPNFTIQESIEFIKKRANACIGV